MKQLKNILFFVAIMVYLVVVTGFISGKEKLIRISGLKVSVTDSSENHFIRSADIRKLIEQNKFSPVGKEISEINLAKIENTLKSKQIIKKAEVFITEPGILHLEISQKSPFIRVFDRTGQGYYLDREGNVIPLYSTFSPFIIVASGYISEPFQPGKTLNMMDVKHDSLSRPLHTIYDVYRLAMFIADDDFWNAQIEQIYVNSNYEFELIPRIGSHIIELGRVENLEEKFDNLKILYTKGFNNTGWNKYEKISLKYKNQVVCTKIQ